MTDHKTETLAIEGTGIKTSPAVPEINWDQVNAVMEARRAEAAEGLKRARAELRSALQALGITALEARYDGYADSGTVGEIDLTPSGARLGALKPRMADFIWDVAYGLHPGFEINDGGEGTVIWNVVADRIDVEHADFYTAREDYSHKDV